MARMITLFRRAALNNCPADQDLIASSDIYLSWKCYGTASRAPEALSQCEKLARESGGDRALQATRDHGFPRISRDRHDDWKILQIVRAGILIARIVRRPPITGQIDIDG
jgi:hypothetical protein